MKFLIIMLLSFVLSACSALRPPVASLYDEGLEGAESFICNDSSVGAVVRRYGISSERAKIWKELCFGDSALDVVTE